MLWFDEAICQDMNLIGGKGANLARMTAKGFPIPSGFVIPAYILEQSVDSECLRALALAQRHQEAQALVRQAQLPRDLIIANYERIGGKVAVRSSACAEDSSTASYAGLQETYLNIDSGDAVCASVINCWASFFSEQALFYRLYKGSLADLGIAVVVQKMLNPVKSGAMVTINPVHHRYDRMIIEATFGMGKMVLSGEATPDHYIVDQAGNIKRQHLINKCVLEQEEIRQLVSLGFSLAKCFGAPQNIEWAIEGGKLYPLQSRPITTSMNTKRTMFHSRA